MLIRPQKQILLGYSVYIPDIIFIDPGDLTIKVIFNNKKVIIVGSLPIKAHNIAR